MVPEIKVSAKPVIQGGEELIDLAPKKPTWDLERDIEKKLDLLEKRTQVCFVLDWFYVFFWEGG